MTGLVGAVVEAWDELRIHRLRVLLALIGVGVAVCAITAVTAAAEMLTQALREQGERDGGRSTTLSINVWHDGSGQGTAPTTEQYLAAFDGFVDRYDVEYASRRGYAPALVRFPGGTTTVDAQVVDPDFGVIHRVQPVQGRWFGEADTTLLAPTLVVNEAFLAQLGVTDLTGHPTVVLQSETPVTAVVVGVVAERWEGETPSAFVLYDPAVRWGLLPPADLAGPPSLEVWVPPELATQVTDLARGDIAAALPGTTVDVWPSSSSYNPLEGGAQWVITGIGAFTLLLGGLGLLNISLVTVRHRIREIGIRRSFGATSSRVFFGVLMESVVATVVAGLVGVVAAVAIVKNIPVEAVFGSPLQDVPPFPVSAAVTGMVCATAVGALAGLVPAGVAVRVKVIDAIRY